MSAPGQCANRRASWAKPQVGRLEPAGRPLPTADAKIDRRASRSGLAHPASSPLLRVPVCLTSACVLGLWRTVASSRPGTIWPNSSFSLLQTPFFTLHCPSCLRSTCITSAASVPWCFGLTLKVSTPLPAPFSLIPSQSINSPPEPNCLPTARSCDCYRGA